MLITGINHLHSFLAYGVLLLLVIAVVFAALGFFQGKIYTDKDKKIFLFALIISHTQLLIGIVQYFLSPYFAMIKDDMAATMADPNNRLLAVEHPFTNILAIILITIGFSKHKKLSEDKSKFKTVLIFYALGLILLLSRIPWSIWMG